MSEAQSFLDHVMAGTVLISEIDDFVERWHQGQSSEELHDYLGMRPEEYSLWLENPDMLAVICAARQRQQSVAEAVNENMLGLRSAARSGNGAKLKSLESWLRRQGIIA
ncbi:MAG: hypothetical protein ACLPN5_23275 [Roseiarcus sp.]